MPNEDESDYEEENESKEETDKEDNKDLEDESDNKEDKDFEEESENEDKSDIEEENNDEKKCDTEERSDIEEENNDEKKCDTEERSDIIEESDNEEGNDNKEGRDFEEQYIETEDEFEFLYNENLDITDESDESDEIIEQNDESEPDFELLYNEEIENDEKSREEQDEEREREKEDDEPNFDELYENKFDVNQEILEESDDHSATVEEENEPDFDELYENKFDVDQEILEELDEIPELLQNDVQNQLNQAEDNFSHLFNDEIYSDLNDDKENLHENPDPEKENNQEQHIENFNHLYADNLNSYSDSDSNSQVQKENDISPDIADKNDNQIDVDTKETSENLGNSKADAHDKNVVNENLSQVSQVSKANEQDNTNTEIENKTKIQEKILDKEIKDLDTKIEVFSAEQDPKSAEKDLKKLPEPPHEKKDKIEKKIEKIENLTQNIENVESNLLQHISENLEKQSKELKEITEKTDENLEKVVIANHLAIEEYKYLYQNAFIYFVDEHWKAQNEIKLETDNNINKSIDDSNKKVEKIENKIEKKFNKTLPTPKGVKNLEGIKPEENRLDETKPEQDKKDENKPEQQIKKINHISENKKDVKPNVNENPNANANANHDLKHQKENIIAPKILDKKNDQNNNTPKINPENLGTNKDSKQEKNKIHEKSDSVSGNSTKNNLKAEKMTEKTVKPGNMTKELIKRENEYKNLIETRLREMKEKDTKSEVHLAELDPKSAEKDLKKLPNPPQERKDKAERKIEKIENKINMLTQKMENEEKQLLQDISKTIDTQTKELNEINEKTDEKIDYVLKPMNFANRQYDQIQQEAYSYYVGELMKAHNEVDKKTNGIIDKSIDEKQKGIDKIDNKIKKAFDKAFPTPKGVKNSEKAETKEKIEEKTKTKEKIEDKKKTKETIKNRTETKEKIKDKKKTKEKVKNKTKKKEIIKDRTKTKEKINNKTKIKENVNDRTKTKEKVKNKTKKKEIIKDRTKTKENIKDITKIKENIKDITKTKLKIKDKTKTKQNAKDKTKKKENVKDITKKKQYFRNITTIKEKVKDKNKTKQNSKDITKTKEKLKEITEEGLSEYEIEVLKSNKYPLGILPNGLPKYNNIPISESNLLSFIGFTDMDGKIVTKNEFCTKALAELFSEADAINLIDPSIKNFGEIRRQSSRDRLALGKIHAKLRNQKEGTTTFYEELQGELTSVSLIDAKLKNSIEGILELTDPNLPLYSRADKTSRQVEIARNKLLNLYRESKLLSKPSNLKSDMLSDILSACLDLNRIFYAHKRLIESYSKPYSKPYKYVNPLAETVDYRNMINTRLDNLVTYTAQIYFIAEISSKNILTMYDHKNVGIKHMEKSLNLDILKIILYEKFKGRTESDVQTIKTLINIQVFAYARRVMAFAYKISDNRRRVDIKRINDFIDTIDLESQILATLTLEWPKDELSMLKKKFIHKYLSANLYLIHSLNEEHTGTNQWLKKLTLLDKNSRLPPKTIGRFKVFINRELTNELKKSNIYHIRVDMKTDSGKIKRLNLRAKSSIEMNAIIDTLKAYDRALGEGGFLKAVFADNFFSRGAALHTKGLAVVTPSYKISRKVGSVLHTYKVSELYQFNIWPELAGGTLTDGDTKLKVGGYSYDIVRNDESVSTLDVGSIFSNPDDALGYFLEILGFELSYTKGSIIMEKINHAAYSLMKDVQCLSNLIAGMVPIYMALEVEYEYYKEAARLPAPYIEKIKNIGIKAPLLKDNHYKMLTDALSFATRIDLNIVIDPKQIPRFEFILRDLSLNYEKYGFFESQRSELVKIQEAFGLIIDSVTHIVEGTIENPDYTNPVVISDSTGIQPDMQQWWENLRRSRQSSSIMNKLYQFYLELIDSDNRDPSAIDFRSKYYWYHG